MIRVMIRVMIRLLYEHVASPEVYDTLPNVLIHLQELQFKGCVFSFYLPYPVRRTYMYAL